MATGAIHPLPPGHVAIWQNGTLNLNSYWNFSHWRDANESVSPADLSEQRPKRTFTFPFARWLARDLKSAIEELFSRARLNAGGVLQADAVGRLWKRFQASPESVGWSRIWNLFVLARWCEAMDVRP